jgi:hypothetical protein
MKHIKQQMVYGKVLIALLVIALLVGGISVPGVSITNSKVALAGGTMGAPTAAAPVTVNAGDNNGFEGGVVSSLAENDGVNYMTSTNTGTNPSSSCTLPNPNSDQHDFYNFNLSVPTTTGTVITGILIRPEGRYDSNTGVNTFCIFLSPDGGATWTAGKNSSDYGTLEFTDNLGGITNTWGRTWTPSELSNTNFRVRVMMLVAKTARDAAMDSLAAEVFYTVPTSVSSADDQVFQVGQSATPISPITITDGNTSDITAANDIRIAIATSTTGMLWDTTDTTAVISGTGAAKVSTTVRYERGGSVLVIPVNSNFANDIFGTGESITVSGLSFTNFSNAKEASQDLVMYLGGVSDFTPEATDIKTITITESI